MFIETYRWRDVLGRGAGAGARDRRVFEPRVVACTNRHLTVLETGGGLGSLVGRRETHVNGGTWSGIDGRVFGGDGHCLTISLEEESEGKNRERRGKSRDSYSELAMISNGTIREGPPY